MCDTIGKIINNQYAIFGKNSDRSVNERQVVEYYKKEDYLENVLLKCTYITIPQAKHTNAIVLSRPTWIWGGEIGVNEYGVIIGNEAVFTKGKYGKESLIGMDLLRLGLERGNTAKESLDIIINLIKKYNQGGNCGYDSKFEYNNSFLIMDRKEIYILETKGCEYVYKKSLNYSISNCLSIEKNGDYYSNKTCNFKKKYSDLIMTFGAMGNKRRNQSINHKLDNINDMIDILRSHDNNAKPFIKGSVSSICMHASNNLTKDQTTMSMIVELTNNDINIYITGCSNPCISLYKPHSFKVNGLIYDYHDENKENYWINHEKFNRKFLNKKVPSNFYDELNNLQEKIIINGKNKIDESIKIEKEFYEKYSNIKLDDQKSSFIFKKFWIKKNKELLK